MLVHKGGQINNVQLITGLRIAEMSQRQGGGGYVQRKEVIVKRNKSWGGGGGVRVDVNGEVKLLWKLFFFFFFFFLGGGGGGGEVGLRGGGVQGGCELRSEAFVKIKKKNWGGGWGWGGQVWGGSGLGGGVRVDVNGEVKPL